MKSDILKELKNLMDEPDYTELKLKSSIEK